jgi:LmbE family N-acetylglucosaminyl deacetylase
VRIICIGAHPDDCEMEFGGTAAKFAAAGHSVKFLAVTNGAAGHQRLSGAAMIEIRRRESALAAERLGIACSEVLAHRDGELQPSLENRHEIVAHIRTWRADCVLTHRPFDYHPDHRYTSQLVQDSAYLVVVPGVCPEIQPLAHNPVFLYLEDAFQMPTPFQPDIAVDIDDVWERKMDALDAHASQVYEWLPWVDGDLDEVPSSPEARRDWLSRRWEKEPSACVQAALARRYGGAYAREVRHAEAFQVCEYGRRPAREELDAIFPR